MAVIPVGYGQANLKFGGAGYPSGAECTWGFKNDAASSASVLADLIGTMWDDSLQSMTPDAVTLDSVLVKLGPNATGEFAEVAVAIAGTDDAGDVVPNMCALVRKNTALGGRRGRGRLYWPIGEATVGDGGALSGTYVTNSTTNWNLFLTSLATNEIPMYLLHNASLPAPTAVNSMSTQAVAATQRRRLRR